MGMIKPLRVTLMTIAIGLLFLLSAPLMAEIVIDAQVDRDQIQIGERFTYSVTVSGAMSLPDIEPPDFDGLQIVSGPSSSSSTQIINTQVSSSKSLSYTLRALKSGQVTIKPAKATHKRKNYLSQAITIEVAMAGNNRSSTNKNSSSQPSSNPTNTQAKYPDIFITATADKDSLYLREMVTITYKLYLSVTVTNYGFAKLPSATGFWQEEFDLPRQPRLQDITIQGQEYKVATIRKIALFPTRTGELVLDPLLADVTVEYPVEKRRRTRDPFNWFFDDRGRRETKTVSTEPLTLTVLDLPRLNRPVNFLGDVGDFSLRVNYDKRELTQHDAITIKVTISGEGYLKSIDAPKLQLPSGFEQFDPTVEDNVSNSNSVIKGKKVFTYLVIPRRVGTFKLQPIEFSFFNPTTDQYNTKRAGGLDLKVNPSDGQQFSENYSSSAPDIIDRDIRFIKNLSKPLLEVETPIYKSTWLYIVLAISPILFLLGISVEKTLELRGSNPAKVRQRKALDLLRKSWLEADKITKKNNPHQAVKIIGEVLKELIGVITNLPTTGMTRGLIKEQLSKDDRFDNEIETIITLFDDIERIRFGYLTIDEETAKRYLSQYRDLSRKLEAMV